MNPVAIRTAAAAAPIHFQAPRGRCKRATGAIPAGAVADRLSWILPRRARGATASAPRSRGARTSRSTSRSSLGSGWLIGFLLQKPRQARGEEFSRSVYEHAGVARACVQSQGDLFE